jgi:predicted nucleotidyltransferase
LASRIGQRIGLPGYFDVSVILEEARLPGTSEDAALNRFLDEARPGRKRLRLVAATPARGRCFNAWRAEMEQSLKSPSWSVTPEKVQEAVRRIVEAGRPLKVILFGSYVRGATHPDSDLDILVVTEDTVENPRKESVRLRRALRGIPMPVDILVVPHSKWEELKDVPGLIYREAAKSGKVVYEL